MPCRLIPVCTKVKIGMSLEYAMADSIWFQIVGCDSDVSGACFAESGYSTPFRTRKRSNAMTIAPWHSAMQSRAASTGCLTEYFERPTVTGVQPRDFRCASTAEMNFSWVFE